MRYKIPPKEVYKSQRYLRLFVFVSKGLNKEEKEWLKERLEQDDEDDQSDKLILPAIPKEEIAVDIKVV